MSSLRRPKPLMTRAKYVKLTANFYRRFKLGYLCWARRDSRRIWPAIISEPSAADLKRYPIGVHQTCIFVRFLVADRDEFVPETEIWDYLAGMNAFCRAKTTKGPSHRQASGSNSKRPLKESNELQETDETVDIYEFNEEDDLNETGDEVNPGHQRFAQIGRRTNSTIQEMPVDQLCLLEPKVVLKRSIYFEKVINPNFKGTGPAHLVNLEGYKVICVCESEDESSVPRKVRKTRIRKKVKYFPVPKINEKIVEKEKIKSNDGKTGERSEMSFEEEREREERERRGKRGERRRSRSSRVIHKHTRESRVINPYEALYSEGTPEASNNESKEMKECAERNLKIGEENNVTVLPPEDIFFSFREERRGVSLGDQRGHSPHVILRNMPKSVTAKFKAIKEARGVSDAKIGIIGVGSLGKRLAHRLLLTGHKVFLWNRSAWKCYNVIDHASSLTKRSPEELVKECDFIFICLTDIHAVKSIIQKYPGFLASIKDKGVINFSTMDFMAQLHVKKIIEKAGALYLHVSLSQSDSNGAANNFLAIVSGSHALICDTLTCFASFASGIYYIDSHEHAANIGVLMNVANASFNVLCSAVFSLLKDEHVRPSHLMRVYNTYHVYTNISSTKQVFPKDHPLSNHLSPKIISQSMASLFARVKQVQGLPMLGVLDEMFNVKSER